MSERSFDASDNRQISCRGIRVFRERIDRKSRGPIIRSSYNACPYNLTGGLANKRIAYVCGSPLFRALESTATGREPRNDSLHRGEIYTERAHRKYL